MGGVSLMFSLVPTGSERRCVFCGGLFYRLAKKTARYCSGACKTRMWRFRKGLGDGPVTSHVLIGASCDGEGGLGGVKGCLGREAHK